MIRTIVQVARGEGLASVLTRTAERIGETHAIRLARGAFVRPPSPPLVNVSAMPPYARFGGVPVQLQARLTEEKKLREVALFHDGMLEVGRGAWRVQPDRARAFIVEGGFGDALTLDDGMDTILVVHDLSLLRDAGRLLPRARAVVFPSQFLCNAYRAVVPHFEARIIEPGIAIAGPRGEGRGNSGAPRPSALGPRPSSVAFAGTEAAEWHVFGGGDYELLRGIRALRRAHVHGYYRAGALPRLLARHRIGLVVLPSIVPESFSLTLSECWTAGVPVVAFDRGALGDRIRLHGGGFLVPSGAGAEGIAAAVREWLRGAEVTVPERVPTAREAAAAHVALYRELGVLP
jgi:hypothetical protein